MANGSGAASALVIGVLGTPSIAVDGGAPAVWNARRALRPFAYLFVHRRAPVLREAAAVALWPDEDQETANANLRRHLYLLSQALPPAPQGTPWVAAGNDRVQLNPQAPLRVDAQAFERKLASGDLEGAVDAYAGDFFEALYDDWIVPERERLRSAFLGALSELVARARSRRDFARAIALAQRLLAVDPLREDIARQLIGVRYEAGDAAGALGEFEAFAKRLRDELGVEPMKETLALREAVRSGGAIEATSSRDTSPGTPHVLTTPAALPFVGRTSELAWLTQRWQRAASGQGCVVTIGGEAGIGKTRLAHEFGAFVQGNGGRVLYGATTYPEPQPYQAVAEVIRHAIPLLDASIVSPVALATLAQIVPQIGAAFEKLPALPAPGGDRQGKLFEAIAVALQALAKPRPLLLVFEDVAWAGAGTLDALNYLARNLAGHPVLLIATYREEDVDRLHALRSLRRALRAQGLLEELSPAPLGAQAVSELLAQFPALERHERDLAAALARRSEGNALFLSEMIRELASGGDALPAAVESAIAARIARLSPAAKLLVQIASVAGSAFDVELVREINGWSGAQTTSALDELLLNRIVRELPGQAATQFAFGHQLIADAVYGAIDPDERAQRHRRVAGVMEELYRDRLDEFSLDLARHFELGGVPATASKYYLSAAERALRMYAAGEALEAVERALQLSQEYRRDALLVRERAFARTGDRDGQRADLDELEGMAVRRNDDELSWEVIRRRCVLARAVGDVDGEKAGLEALDLRARTTGNLRWQAEACKLDASFALMTADFARCKQSGQTALERYEALGDASGAIETLCILTRNEEQGGSWELAREFARDAERRAITVQDSAAIAHATVALAHTAVTRHDFDAYRELLGKALSAFRSIGDAEGEASALNGIGTACLHLGELAAAREHLTNARDVFAAIGARRGRVVTLVNLGVIEWKLGRLDLARDAMTQARDAAAFTDFVLGHLTALTNLSAIARTQGRLDEATAAAHEALALAQRAKLPVHVAEATVVLAAVQRCSGDPKTALETARSALAAYDGAQHPANEVELQAELAECALAAGDNDAALASVRALLAAPKSAFRAGTFPQAYCWVAARTFLATGQPRLAREQLDAALALIAERAGQCTDDAEREAFARLPLNVEIVTASSPST